jgi:hypothetical protein
MDERRQDIYDHVRHGLNISSFVAPARGRCRWLTGAPSIEVFFDEIVAARLLRAMPDLSA